MRGQKADWHTKIFKLAPLVLALATCPSWAQDNAETIKKQEFHIASQPLSAALMEFSQQSEYVVVASADLVANKYVSEVNGMLTWRDALSQILAGTNLEYDVKDKSTLVFRKKGSGSGVFAEDGSDSVERRMKDKKSSKIVEEIIVTATKRETSLQDTAMSIDVLSERLLKNRGVTSVHDIISTVPGISQPSSAPILGGIVVRGVASRNSGDSPDVGSTTATYLDEFPVSGGTANIELIDIERVEVLKGPQGTLYGKSAMGGALRYISNKPDPDAFSGSVRSYASTTADGGNNYGFQGVVNVPLTNDLAMRFVGYHFDNDGFIDAVGFQPQEDANYNRTSGGRVTLRWQATENITVDAQYLNQMMELGAEPNYITSTFTPEPTPTPFALPDDTEAPDVDDPKNQRKAPYDQDFELLNLKLAVNFGGFDLNTMLTHKEIDTIYRNEYNPFVGRLDGAIPAVGNYINRVDSAELRLVSNSDNSSIFDWIVGYWHEEEEINQTTIATLLAAPGQSTGTLFGLTFPDGFVLQDYGNFHSTGEDAVYGELSLHVSERTDLTVGYRHSNIEQENYVIYTRGPLDGLGGAVPATADETVDTYKLSLDHRLTDDALLYALVSSGYRAGGINAGELLSPPTSYTSDSLWNYEFGAKTSWLDSRLTVNATLYRIDWTDMQLFFRRFDGVRGTFNVGESRIEGVELATSYSVSEDIYLGFNFSHTDAVLTADYPDGNAVAGDRLPGSAKITWSLFADWRKPLTDQLDFNMYLTHRYSGERENALGAPAGTNQIGDAREAYHITDLRMGLSHTSGVDVMLFAKNLFDERHMETLGSFPSGMLGGSMNMPRIIGLDVTYDF